MASFSQVSVDLPSGGGKMQRTMPLELRQHISTAKWTAFCDSMDQIATSANDRVKQTGAMGCGCTVLGFLLFGLGGFLSVRNFSFSPLVPIGFLLFGGGAIASMCLVTRLGNEVRESLTSACDKASTDFGTVTVHYKEHTDTYTSGVGSDREHHSTTKMWLEFHYPSTNDGIVESTIPVVVPIATAPAYAYAERLDDKV